MPRTVYRDSFLDNLESLPSGCIRYRFENAPLTRQYTLTFNKHPYTPRRLAYLLHTDKPLSSCEEVRQRPTCTTRYCCNPEHLHVVQRTHLNPGDYYDAIAQLRAQLKKD